MTTGARMKYRRKELGLSAETVAEAIKVSPATIYRYEKGDIEKVPGDILEPLSKALHTTPAYLMGWDDNPESFNTNNDVVVKLDGKQISLEADLISTLSSESIVIASAYDKATDKEKAIVRTTLGLSESSQPGVSDKSTPSKQQGEEGWEQCLTTKIAARGGGVNNATEEQAKLLARFHNNRKEDGGK